MRTRDINKEQLVKEKAMELVVAEGVDGFSMNKLAKACEISVATLYIYYKDKDDLITKIATEEAERMNSIVLAGFDPDASFETGLRQQWKNRARHMLENPLAAMFAEALRSSSYHETAFKNVAGAFKENMGRFMKNALERGEVDAMPLEVYWSVAFAPLYNLVRFHNEGRSIGGKKFVLNDKILWQTFDYVLKALKKK